MQTYIKKTTICSNIVITDDDDGKIYWKPFYFNPLNITRIWCYIPLLVQKKLSFFFFFFNFLAQSNVC